MSQKLFTVRSQLTQVPRFLKQNSLVSAARAVQNAVALLLSTQLIRSEITELEQLITDGCKGLNAHAQIRKIYSLVLEFDPKKPQQLYEHLAEVIKALEVESAPQALEPSEQLAIKKQQALDKGQEELDVGAHDKARKTFSDIVEECSDDAQLATDVGDKFMNSGLYEDASHYFTHSLEARPNSPHVFNRLGIALRKIKRFEASEENFKKALAIEANDPHLHFNLARLYLDWGRLPASIEEAERALQIKPDFAEARQLMAYAKKTE